VAAVYGGFALMSDVQVPRPASQQRTLRESCLPWLLGAACLPLFPICGSPESRRSAGELVIGRSALQCDGSTVQGRYLRVAGLAAKNADGRIA